MNMQFEQQRLASVVKRNLKKFKILVGDKEKKFNDLMCPFTKLDTFINAKTILKQIVKPTNKQSDTLTPIQSPKHQLRSTFVNGDFNPENFYDDVDDLIQQLEKEESETIMIGNKKISRSEILELKKKNQNYDVVSKQFAQKSNQLIALLNRQSTRIYNKKYSVIHMQPRKSSSHQIIPLQSERDPAHSRYSNYKMPQLVELRPQKSQFKIKTESKTQRNYNDKIQQLITNIEDVHKQMTDETGTLKLKTSRFILNQCRSNPSIKAFDYLTADTNFTYSKIKRRVL